MTSWRRVFGRAPAHSPVDRSNVVHGVVHRRRLVLLLRLLLRPVPAEDRVHVLREGHVHAVRPVLGRSCRLRRFLRLLLALFRACDPVVVAGLPASPSASAAARRQQQGRGRDERGSNGQRRALHSELRRRRSRGGGRGAVHVGGGVPMPARRATRELRERGLVVTLPAKGTFVTYPETTGDGQEP